jgi:hypothetical protein
MSHGTGEVILDFQPGAGEQAVAGQAEEGWDLFVEIAREIGDSVLADRPKRRSGQLHPDKVAAVPDALLQVPARHGSGV